MKGLIVRRSHRLLKTMTDIISVSCGLDPRAFQNGIPNDQEGRSTWTKTQRGKAEGCPVLNTIGELSTWMLGFCLYPINPSRFSNQYHTGADRCTPTLPR